jgi:copper(I)-binding protein
MRELDELLVPARGNVTLERGGKHLMLMRPQDLGETVTLHFFNEDMPVLTVDYSFSNTDKDQ